MYVYAVSNYENTIVAKSEDKKHLLRSQFNRTDSFINLALYGAQECIDEHNLATNASVYMASRNGDINATLKVMDAIFLKKQLPMPFHFLNSVNAATLFYIAKSFSLEGKTLFVDRFESAIPQALADVGQGKEVLLGYVEEVINDIDEHKKRFMHIAREESRWILLSKEKRQKPLAKIANIEFSGENKQDAIKELFTFLSRQNHLETFSFSGNNLSFNVQGLQE